MTDDERLLQLKKESSRLGFKLVYIIDGYSLTNRAFLEPTTVKTRFGIHVADGDVPIDLVPKLIKEDDDSV